MKSKLCFIMLGLSMMLGCTGKVQFYPVQGPLSEQKPLPVLTAKATGAFRSGDFSVVLSDGEVCKGRWAQVRPTKVSKDAITATVATTDDMSSVWDTVYGQGFYVAHVLGAQLYVQAVLTGDRGTVVHVELYRPEGGHVGSETSTGTGKGVAKDNKGNIYKLVF